MADEKEIERIRTNYAKFGKSLRHDDCGTLLAALDEANARADRAEAKLERVREVAREWAAGTVDAQDLADAILEEHGDG